MPRENSHVASPCFLTCYKGLSYGLSRKVAIELNLSGSGHDLTTQESPSVQLCRVSCELQEVQPLLDSRYGGLPFQTSVTGHLSVPYKVPGTHSLSQLY